MYIRVLRLRQYSLNMGLREIHRYVHVYSGILAHAQWRTNMSIFTISWYLHWISSTSNIIETLGLLTPMFTYYIAHLGSGRTSTLQNGRRSRSIFFLPNCYLVVVMVHNHTRWAPYYLVLSHLLISTLSSSWIYRLLYWHWHHCKRCLEESQ